MNARENTEFANQRYADMVQVAERRALWLPLAEPQSRGSGGLYRSAANWLARRRPSLGQGLLASRGFLRVDDPSGADVVLVNTCAIREHAEGFARLVPLRATASTAVATRSSRSPRG